MDPAQLSNFETEARRLRYQALGRACVRFGIRRLVMAHHNDDQAETVLMQMLTPGRTRLSLKGTPVKGNIPECWGIHGADGSGLEEFNRRLGKGSRFRKDTPQPNTGESHMELGIEDGGVMIFRPLLEFSKDELRQTCIENRTEWVEDQSNQDPTITKRNAVRLLLRSEQLPKALSKNFLLGLREMSISRVAAITSRAVKLFGKFKIIAFDARCSRISARIPSLRLQDLPDIPEQLQKRRQWEAIEKTSRAIRFLLSIVSPQEIVHRRRLAVAVRSLFPDILGPGEDPGSLPTKFTVAGVLCAREDAPISDGEGETSKDSGHQNVWTFSREPLNDSKAPRPIQISPTLPELTQSPRSEPGSSMVIPQKRSMTIHRARWSRFHLWDGRFWIRVQNRTSHVLVVRSLKPSDMRFLHATLPQKTFRNLRATIAVVAPGGIRWTLPVVVIPASSSTDVSSPASESPRDSASTRQDTPICFPTLGSTLTSVSHCITETRHRKVDFGPHVPTHKPSTFRITDLDFVITRSGPETKEQKKAEQEREISRAQKHAKNLAWRRLKREEGAETKELQAHEEAAGVFVNQTRAAKVRVESSQPQATQMQSQESSQPRCETADQSNMFPAEYSGIKGSASIEIREASRANTRHHERFSNPQRRDRQSRIHEVTHDNKIPTPHSGTRRTSSIQVRELPKANSRLDEGFSKVGSRESRAQAREVAHEDEKPTPYSGIRRSASMQIREVSKADNRLYEDFSEGRRRERIAQAREIASEEKKDEGGGGGGGDDTAQSNDDDDDDFVFPHSSDGDPWKSFTPREPFREPSVEGAGVSGGWKPEKKQPRREMEAEVEGQDKWQERDHWREWI